MDLSGILPLLHVLNVHLEWIHTTDMASNTLHKWHLATDRDFSRFLSGSIPLIMILPSCILRGTLPLHVTSPKGESPFGDKSFCF